VRLNQAHERTTIKLALNPTASRLPQRDLAHLRNEGGPARPPPLLEMQANPPPAAEVDRTVKLRGGVAVGQAHARKVVRGFTEETTLTGSGGQAVTVAKPRHGNAEVNPIRPKHQIRPTDSATPVRAEAEPQ